jgi:hypothetical protein
MKLLPLLAFAGLGAAPLAALSADRPEAALWQELRGCAAISAADARLACYDSVAQRHATPEKAAQQAKQEFGLPATDRVASLAIETIEAKVVGIGRSAAARPALALDNGQVWEVDAPEAPVELQQTVSIKRAAMSSFLLTTPRKRSYRARRIR